MVRFKLPNKKNYLNTIQPLNKIKNIFIIIELKFVLKIKPQNYS